MGTVERIKEPFPRPSSRQVRADSTLQGQRGTPSTFLRNALGSFPDDENCFSEDATRDIDGAYVSYYARPSKRGNHTTGNNHRRSKGGAKRGGHSFRSVDIVSVSFKLLGLSSSSLAQSLPEERFGE